MADIFEKRIRRAGQLQKEWPYAAELLSFYEKVWALQREHLPPPLFAARFLEIVVRHGPPGLAESAKSIPDVGTALSRRSATKPEDPLLTLLLRLQGEPTSGTEGIETDPTVHRCPICGGRPQISVLREDKGAETVRRSLICARGDHEWDFARVVCPACNEEKPEKLPRFSAQEIPWMRVEACDSCGKYLKSVDLTLNWDAEPVVDELASTPLDVIAHEHGYVKIAPNLAGI